MPGEEFMTAARQIAYLAGCLFAGQRPDPARVAEMDRKILLRLAQRHSLEGLVAHGLEQAGVREEAFVQAGSKAARKVVLLNAERDAVLARLEDAGIWYLPLKGAVLQRLYPVVGTRQMADVDILFDPVRRDDVRRIMVERGYTVKLFDAGTHDVYMRPPVYNFEMHTALFDATRYPVLAACYRQTETLLLPDGTGRMGRRLSPDDFYVYLIAHAYKHYAGGGNGLRSLLDIYAVLRRGEPLREDCVAARLDQLGLTGFEREYRQLACHYVENALTADEEKKLLYLINSGTYGTVENSARNQVASQGRLRFVLSHAFIPTPLLRAQFPVLQKAPVLLPVMVVWRWIRAPFIKPRRVAAQLRSLLHKKKSPLDP